MRLPDIQDYIELLYRGKLTPGQRIVNKDYAYSVNAQALAAGGNVSPIINMQANADFLVLGASIRVTAAGAAQTVANAPIPNIRMLVTDTGSNEQWTQQAVDVSQWLSQNTANGWRKDLNYPRLLGGRSSVTVQMTSYEAAQAWTVDFLLHGVLIYILGA